MLATIVVTQRDATHAQVQNPIPASPSPSVLDALLRPTDFRFAEPTTLEEVALSLHKQHDFKVVLDRAALIRLELEPNDRVQLQLDGVRLQTSLQLLLDQVGMTFRVVPEDNLLILTDNEGADEPYRHILSEIDILHREIHELRDAVDALYDNLIPPGGDPPVRNPTLIEPLPGAELHPEPSAPPGHDTTSGKPRRNRPASRRKANP